MTPEERKRRDQRKYAKTEKGRAVNRKADRKYANSKRGRAVKKRYRKTEKYLAAHREYQRKYRERTKEKKKANNALNNAIRDGHIERPGECSSCGKKCMPDGHHSDYSQPLNVKWLCRTCHVELHSTPCPECGTPLEYRQARYTDGSYTREEIPVCPNPKCGGKDE